jgi:hypothetical protein
MPLSNAPATRSPALVCYALAAALLVIGGVLGWFGRGCAKVAQPPAVGSTAETTQVVIHDTTYQVVTVKPNADASKELAKLRDDIAGKDNFIGQLISIVDTLQLENRYLADSLSRVSLAALRGMVQVTRTPYGMTVATYESGEVRKYRLGVWRERFTLTAGKDAPTAKTSRLPLDLGLFAGGGYTSAMDTWTPAPYLRAGLSLSRSWLTARGGVMFDGQIKPFAEVTLECR